MTSARANVSTHRRIACGQSTLAAEILGAGDPVVFLHVSICDSRMWRAQRDAVGAHHKAITYDRRGFGDSPSGSEAFSAVEDLMTVIDAVADGRRAVLVGCSEGGRIAIDAALKHPARVRALFLVSPSVSGAPVPVYPPAIASLMAQLGEAQKAGDLDRVNAIKARLFLDGPLAPEGRVSGNARDLFLTMHGAILRSPPIGSTLDVAPAFDRLDEITAPTRIIWGDLEFPHIQQRSRALAATIPNASGHVVRDTAHLPSLDQPTAVTQLLRDFLGKLPA